MDITSKSNDDYKRNIVPLNSFYIKSKSRRILYLQCKYYSYSINLYDRGDGSTFLKDCFPLSVAIIKQQQRMLFTLHNS
jgi:hypothetical protein